LFSGLEILIQQSWIKTKKMKVEIKIDESVCKACGYCIEACPKKALVFAKHFNKGGFHPAQITDKEKCTGCASCYQVCPEIAITIKRES